MPTRVRRKKLQSPRVAAASRVIGGATTLFDELLVSLRVMPLQPEGRNIVPEHDDGDIPPIAPTTGARRSQCGKRVKIGAVRIANSKRVFSHGCELSFLPGRILHQSSLLVSLLLTSLFLERTKGDSKDSLLSSHILHRGRYARMYLLIICIKYQLQICNSLSTLLSLRLCPKIHFMQVHHLLPRYLNRHQKGLQIQTHCEQWTKRQTFEPMVCGHFALVAENLSQMLQRMFLFQVMISCRSG